MPNICETYTKKFHCWLFFLNFFIYLFFEMIFNDFVEYDGWHDVMMHDMLWFSFWNYMICLHGYVDAWLKFVFFHFSFILIWKQGKRGLEARKKNMWGQTKLGLGAKMETGLGANVETGLEDQCGNWAWGLVWKLGLGASVKTRLGDQCGNWAWGPVWKLGLGTSVRIRLGG